MHILTINGGASSVKFALFEPTESVWQILSGAIKRIGLPGCGPAGQGFRPSR